MRKILAFYFSSGQPLVRAGLRGLCVPIVKYLLLHFMLDAAMKWDCIHKDNLFMTLVLPMGTIIASGSVMQLAANSYTEAILMQGVAMVLVFL